ncbi:MAG: UvrD-helicase domain-containing protein, partial [Sphingomonadaceae bacterium]|nr:UvrD-helicase domain-containing protein [Sphingomonadaceae bacterium]
RSRPGSPSPSSSVREVWCTKKGDFRKFAARLGEAESDYAALAGELDDVVRGMLDFRALAAFADVAVSALRAGQRFAREYGLAKRRRGLVDFDDLIREAVVLLKTPGMGDWVRYKLDQSIDHILVDEAQDTNKAQWEIVRALAGEFLETAPEDRPRPRTIFAVGDFKQAIFGFQGTNPREFLTAREAFARYIADRERELLDIPLDESYRSSPPILDFVDAAICELGHEAIGLDRAVNAHRSALKKARLPGRVTLWEPVHVDEQPADEGEEGWIDDAKRTFAGLLARQVREWLDDGLWLEGQGRALRPEDVLILVRSRVTLAPLIVARLHAEGVPVAGVDRLTLTAPLAIRDLLAALRFALQPRDDLTLASLLVSPLFGWSQDALYESAFGRRGDLWRTIRESGAHGETVAGLEIILGFADLSTPYQLLETILSGPIDGRRKLLARLGEEARDPIEELLNAALAFEGEGTPTLQRFIDWFDRGEVEIKRDPSAPLDAVRVMTVHGAKGLQAPLVILADATADPDKIPFRSIALDVPGAGQVPLPRPRKAEQLGALTERVEALSRAEREEHWRLLYVALTRAEERLVIGGALGKSARDGAPRESWYALCERAMARLGGEAGEDMLFGEARHFAGAPPTEFKRRETRERIAPPLHAQPAWLRAP